MDKTTFNFDPANNTGLLLWQASNKWQRELNKALVKHRLTHVQLLLLGGVYSLGQAKKHITQMTLAQFLGMDKMMTSKVLRALESKKLIKRTVDKADKRAIQVVLTSFGDQILKKVSKDLNQFEDTFFAGISDKQKSFNKKLKKLTEATIS